MPLVMLMAAALAADPAPLRAPADYSPMRSLAPLVDAVMPAVLVLEVDEQPVDVPEAFRDFLSLPEARRGEGSGFLISTDGLAVTNAHVVADAQTIHARLSDGSRVPVTVLGMDEATDVALLSLGADRAWPYLEFGSSSEVRVGDWVVAIGNPLGLGHTVTAGIVSGKGRVLGQDVFGSDDYIQTDAAINQGNSGGPVFDLSGRVVGVANAIIAGANTVGFAIPADLVGEVVRDLQAHGKVVRGFIGVRPEPLTNELAATLGVREGPGAVIGTVFAGTPADRGGLRAGDVVVAVDDAAIAGPSDLIAAIGGHRPGETVRLTVLRGARERTVSVQLGERPSDEEPPEPVPPTLGLDLRLVDGEVVVRAIADGTPAADRLEPGDVVLEIGGKAITSPAEVQRQVNRANGTLFFLVRRDGEQRSVAVPMEP
ncbi:MAG: serine protease Do [Myxococcota bacterium]|jgi:serine protease Do